MQKKIRFNSVVWQEGEYYIAQCLEVEVSSFGKTKKEALLNLQDALILYYEDASFPEKAEVHDPTVESIELQYA
jgi:predicted RNase H-like HicB family nuclease